MTVYPLFENIDGRTFLIIGGGKVAAGKVRRLLQFTNRIVVVAEETEITGVKVLRKTYEPSDLERGDYVIVATSNRALNREIAAECRAQRIPVNVVDDPELCSFIFPSVIKKGDLTIGISTGGTSPAYAQQLRKEIEDSLPEDIAPILERMARLRKTTPSRIKDGTRRAECYRRILALLLADSKAGEDAIEAVIREYEDSDKC